MTLFTIIVGTGLGIAVAVVILLRDWPLASLAIGLGVMAAFGTIAWIVDPPHEPKQAPCVIAPGPSTYHTIWVAR